MKTRHLTGFLAACLLALQPAVAQFNTVGKVVKMAAVQSTGNIGTGHATVTPDGKIAEHMPPAAPKEKDLGNINRQKTGAAETGPTPAAPKDTVRNLSPLFSPPLETLHVTSHYGMRLDPITGKKKFHKGTDYRTASENVYAMMPGRISKIGYDRRLGNYIKMEHGDFEVTYGHLHTVAGRKGDTVNAGQSVGISGSTGRSTGDHLHISIKYRGKNINPEPFVRYIYQYATTGQPLPSVAARP